MNEKAKKNSAFPLKDAIFLGFCAMFIVLTKAALRLHLNISGHSMFFLIFFLMLARGCVKYRLAALFTGLLAGLTAMAFGMGKGGPLMLLKFLFPAAAIDLGAFLYPALFVSTPSTLLLAFAACASRFVSDYAVDYLVGMDKAIMLQHALIKSAGGITFGMAGGLFIPPVIRKLKTRGIID
jgi:hypothetical protein